MSNKVLSVDHQQERVKSNIDPWYIVGFVEGEGTFHVAFYLDPRMKRKIKVIPEFHVSQSYLRIETLEQVKNYFGCGYIKINHAKNPKDTTYVYVVRDRRDLLKRIIPFFRKYSLRSVKQKSFKIFSKITESMAKRKHLTRPGLRNIISQAYKMNIDGKYRIRKKEKLLQALLSSETIR